VGGKTRGLKGKEDRSDKRRQDLSLKHPVAKFLRLPGKVKKVRSKAGRSTYRSGWEKDGQGTKEDRKGEKGNEWPSDYRGRRGGGRSEKKSTGPTSACNHINSRKGKKASGNKTARGEGSVDGSAPPWVGKPEQGKARFRTLKM